MKNPIDDDMPRWYGISFDRKEMSILLKIHPAVMEYLKTLPWQYGSDGKSGYGANFRPPTETSFGFDGVLKLVKSEDWYVWSAKLPILRSTDVMRMESSPEYVSNLRKTLQVVFNWLRFHENETDSLEKQLLVIDGMGTGIGRNSAGLSLSVTPTMSKWVALNKDKLEQAKQVMIDAYNYMWTSDHPRSSCWFRVQFREGNGLSINVDSDARNLTHGGFGLKLGEGYDLHTHNFDSALDQFILIALLGTLHDLASLPV